MSKLNSYRIYLHGEFVGIIDDAMTREEAVVKFKNKNPEYAIEGLMAVEY